MADFESFKRRIEKEFLSHPVILNNPYTSWFKRGLATEEQVIDLIEQFSVFSNHFLVVQVKRMVHAGTEEGERCARNILVSECGVGIDPKSGSAEGKTFSSSNAHINWLREIGVALGLEPMRLGRWDLATQATRKFLNGLDRTYGSLDGRVGAGASFAIENWAAFGIGRSPEAEAKNFWKELIAGLEAFNRKERVPSGLDPIPLGFFQYHFSLESGHGAGVWRELEETFRQGDFDSARFIRSGRIALDSIGTFWQGLDDTRRRLDLASQRSHVSALDGINIAQWAF